jgi:HAD superfamily hydrolase (TIGR01509 family)
MSRLTLRLPVPCAFLFDIDGTIADTHPLHFAAYTRALAPLTDVRIDWAAYVDVCLRQGRTFEELLSMHGISCDGRALHAAKSAWFRELGKGRLELRPGLPELWADLTAAGVRLGLVSTARRASIESFLSVCPTPTKPDVVICREEVGPRVKPDPFGFQLAAQQFQVPPEQCLVIEDAPAGVQAARKAGMRCIAFRSTIFQDIDLASADAIFDRFTDLAPLIDQEAGKLAVLS